MKALVTRAPGVITNPIPGAPVLVDPSIDPHVSITIEDYVGTYDDEDAVTSIVGEGWATSRWRTLDRKLDTFNYPIMRHGVTPTGKAAIEFAGSEMLANARDSSQLDLIAMPQLDEYTLVMVMKVLDWTGMDNEARFIGGLVAPRVRTVRPNTATPGRINIQLGGAIYPIPSQ